MPVFSREKRNFVGKANIAQGLAGPCQLRGLELAVGIFHGIESDGGPAEVVHAPDVRGIASHGHDPPDSLVDDAGGHVIGVDGRILGKQGLGEGQSLVRLQHRPDHRRVAMDIAPRSNHRLDHAGALHFVVVLARDPFLGADVGTSQNIGQKLSHVFRGAQDRFEKPPVLPAGSIPPRTPTGESRIAEGPCPRRRRSFRRRPHGVFPSRCTGRSLCSPRRVFWKGP